MTKDPTDISTLLNEGRTTDLDSVTSEIKMGVLAGVVARRRSGYYYRDFGCSPMENYPAGLSMILGVRHAVASYVAQRNLKVGDGTNGTIDRRAITSQNYINVLQDSAGNMSVQVYVVPTIAMSQAAPLTIPMGGR